MTLISVEGFNELKKDPTSGGVVNVDKRSYESYLHSKAVAQRNIQQQKVTQDAVVHLQTQINNIEGDLTEIRSLLLQLIQKGN